MASVAQKDKECSQDFRRLTSENAALIAEMNTLRTERGSFQRSCKEMEATLMSFKSRGKGDSGMNRSESAPELGGDTPGSQGSGGQRRGKGGAADPTPYVRRKVVDQQDLYRRQRQKQMNQLPPVNQPSGKGQGRSVRFKASPQ